MISMGESLRGEVFHVNQKPQAKMHNPTKPHPDPRIINLPMFGLRVDFMVENVKG